MGNVNQAIEDDIGQRGIAHCFMPVEDRQLASDHGGADIDAILEDFQGILSSVVIQCRQAPVIDNQEVSSSQVD